MKDEEPQIPKGNWLWPKYEGWRCVSQLCEELSRVGRKPYLVWIFGSAGGEGYVEADTKEEAFRAACAFNWYEEYVAAVYDANGKWLRDEYEIYNKETWAKTEMARRTAQLLAQRKQATL